MHHKMPRILFCILALTFLPGAGQVQTRDGKTLTGDIAFDEGAIALTVAGTATRIPLDQISSLQTTFTPPPTAEAATDGSLPPNWKSQDIGRVKNPGSAQCVSKGLFSLSASGWGGFGGHDSLQFAYRTLEGDGQIIAHVVSLDLTNGPIVAGVMMRESTAPDSPMAAAVLHPTGDVHMNKRPMSTSPLFKGGDEPLPKNPSGWVRLTRRGDAITSFRSNDGKYWQSIESHKMPNAGPLLVGVAAWTTGNAWVGRATLDLVTIIPGTPGMTYFPGSDPLTAGIVFKDGTTLACDVIGVSITSVRYLDHGKGAVVPRESVARIVFNPMPADITPPGATRGVLLSGGDLFEGDLAELSLQTAVWGQPKIVRATFRSLLFGNKTFDAATQIIAIDLAEQTPSPATWELRTADGSTLRAQKISLQKTGVQVDTEAEPRMDIVNIKKL